MRPEAAAAHITEPDRDASHLLLHAIHPTNLLSFGPDTAEIRLGSLNLLIGPNGSGKSNLIEAIALLRSAASDIADAVRRGGGIGEWIWKGSPDRAATLSAVIDSPESAFPLRHTFSLAAANQTFDLVDEVIRDNGAAGAEGETEAALYYPRPGTSRISAQEDSGQGGFGGGSVRGGFGRFGQTPFAVGSVLRQLRDPVNHPQITYLAAQYESIRLYRAWQFGPNTIFRLPQRADMRTDRLEEDFSNLGLFLNRLRRHPEAKRTILGYLRDIYEGVDDFDVSVEGGTVQVFFTEGKFTIPATRLSDGTLRYLCLLAILCDPAPPPLVCIEEPELGLHPDIMPKIADLLVEASTRTQLIVTTHSEILVDAMTERPEVVLVCEKHAGQTHLSRLSREALTVWLEKYRLGELWTRGEIGGTRW